MKVSKYAWIAPLGGYLVGTVAGLLLTDAATRPSWWVGQAVVGTLILGVVIIVYRQGNCK